MGTYIGDVELETDLHKVNMENKRLKITKVDNRTIELYIHISRYRNAITLDENLTYLIAIRFDIIVISVSSIVLKKSIYLCHFVLHL